MTARSLNKFENSSFVFQRISFVNRSFDSSLKVLSKVFWVRIDQTNSSAAKPRERTVDSLTNLIFIDLRPNAWTDRVGFKRYFVEFFILYRIMCRLISLLKNWAVYRSLKYFHTQNSIEICKWGVAQSTLTQADCNNVIRVTAVFSIVKRKQW